MTSAKVGDNTSLRTVRRRVRNRLGYVLDRLPLIHLLGRADDVAAIRARDDLLHWANGTLAWAASRITDPDCHDAVTRLENLCNRLRTATSAETIRRVGCEMNRIHGDAFRMLVTRLESPESSRGPAPPGHLQPEVDNWLGLEVDEQQGQVRRRGCGLTVTFTLDTAEWRWFLVAYRAGKHGATREQLCNGYPGEKSAMAMRQAKKRASSKLVVLGIELEPRKVKLAEIANVTARTDEPVKRNRA